MLQLDMLRRLAPPGVGRSGMRIGSDIIVVLDTQAEAVRASASSRCMEDEATTSSQACYACVLHVGCTMHLATDMFYHRHAQTIEHTHPR